MNTCVHEGLAELGYELVSTGGSASAIEGGGLPVRKVEELTGFPEMLDGSVSGGPSPHCMMCRTSCRPTCACCELLMGCLASEGQ